MSRHPLSREAFVWRYLSESTKVRHALRRDSLSLAGHSEVALCGVGAWWNGWRGTGSQGEYERVDALPECRKCAAQLTPAAGAP